VVELGGRKRSRRCSSSAGRAHWRSTSTHRSGSVAARPCRPKTVCGSARVSASDCLRPFELCLTVSSSARLNYATLTQLFHSLLFFNWFSV
jgi:hypothetical protein